MSLCPPPPCAVQASKPMMEISTIIAKALISYAAIAVLVVLFWIVFGIVGMNVFGGWGSWGQLYQL